MADVYTGSADELADILESWSAHELLCAWRDAAVARHLAEAGAVHPGVHTPTRVMQWLEQHGWERAGGADIAIAWDRFPRRVYVPVNANAVDYGRRVSESLRDAAYVHDMTLSQVLAEVAALPDEWAW